MAFGGGVFGGSGGVGGASVGVPLSEIIMPAYRIAGITMKARIRPNADMFAEAVPELNRFIGGLNTSRLNIFTVAINEFQLTTAKVFTIGPGADFDMARPQRILQGVVVIPGTGATPVRLPPMYQMDDEEWSWVSLQDVPNAVPLAFYYDGSYDTSTGYGSIYLWPQASAQYQVEWYTWQALPTFATQDDIVSLPPGAEDMLVYNLAKRLAALNPRESKMDPMSYAIARDTLAAWQSYNAPQPKVIVNDAASCSDPRGAGGHFDWRTGIIR